MRATGQFIKGTKAGEAVTSAVTGAGSKLSTKAGRVVSSIFGNKAGQKAAAATEKYANGFNRATSSIKRKMSSAYNAGE